MSDVMLSASMNQNLLALRNTQSMFDDVQEKLATGKEVNSAMDDPAAYYTAQSLTQRASDLDALMDSMGQAVQTLNAADQGITALSSFNEQAKSIANQARDSSDKVKPVTVEIGSGLTGSTEVNTHATETLDLQVTVDGAALGAEIDLAVDATVDDFISAINSATDLNGLKASLEGGKIVLDGGDMDIGTVEIEAGATGGGTALAGVIGATFDVESSEAAADYADKFNAILDQMDQLAKDSSYKGTNLLQSDDLLVVFNEDRSSSLNISGVDMSSSGLGLSSVTGDDFSSNTSIDATIAKIDAATDTLRTQSAEFGNNLSIVETRTDFTENLINTLEEGANELIQADTTELSAQMLQLQTNQSLGMNALSLASQSASSILQLF